MANELIQLTVVLQDKLRSATVKVDPSLKFGDILREAIQIFGFGGKVYEGAALREKGGKLLSPDKTIKEEGISNGHIIELIIGLRESE